VPFVGLREPVFAPQRTPRLHKVHAKGVVHFVILPGITKDTKKITDFVPFVVLRVLREPAFVTMAYPPRNPGV
jgi:hypothetical protein